MVKFSVVVTGHYWPESFFTQFLSYKILYVWLEEKVMTVICYTFTTSVQVLYHFHLLMVNIEHLVACLVQEVFKVVFISQNYRVRLAERPGDVDTKYHDKLNTSWGQQETRRI